jgi:hypothetical protein
MNKTVTLTFVALSISACVFTGPVKLNPQGAKVEMVSETEKPSECNFLGKITGTSHDDDAKAAREGAENDLRNQTAALKGNFAVVENVRGERDIVINGKAYECKTLDMQLAEEEKHQAAVEEKEQREEKEKADREAKAEEAKAKREQDKRDREEKLAAEEQERKDKKKDKKSPKDDY